MGRIYYQHVKITDFGPYVTKLVLAMPSKVKEREVSTEAFDVYVEVLNPNGSVVVMPKDFLHRDELVESKGKRIVLAAYTSDKDGERKLEESEYITLELAYGPIYPVCSLIVADFKNINGHEYYAVHDYTITLTKPVGEFTDLVFDKCAGVSNPGKDLFNTGISTSEVPLKYGYYMPELNGGKKPLVVWLHGAGEGGWDLPIAYSGNKVTALASEYFQNIMGGAVIYVPQCPTMWLDDGSGQYGDSGQSMYVNSLKESIDEFIAKNADVIDTDRIIVGGDSNGGFMTMRMILSFPDFFAAAFPICEAMIDERITDQDIENIKNIPIWFTHSADDPIVVPDKYVLPTYDRLIKAGAKDVHLTYFDHVEDVHEGFKDQDGNPYRYLGHFVWIPLLNDDCRLDFDGKPVIKDGREVTLMQWLSTCHR